MEAFSKRERRRIISLYQSGLDTVDIAQQFSASESGVRRIWMQRISHACDGDFSRVLFIDETGAMTNLIRWHGRSVAGARCVAYAPNGHWKIVTAIAAIGL